MLGLDAEQPGVLSCRRCRRSQLELPSQPWVGNTNRAQSSNSRASQRHTAFSCPSPRQLARRGLPDAVDDLFASQIPLRVLVSEGERIELCDLATQGVYTLFGFFAVILELLAQCLELGQRVYKGFHVA